jgi:hypothetical protein
MLACADNGTWPLGAPATPGKGIVGNFLCAANQVVPVQQAADSPYTRVTCSAPLVGQYLYIQIPAVNSTLTLCEVKVDGSYCGTNAWTDHCTLPDWNPRGLVTCPEDCVGLRSKVSSVVSVYINVFADA